MIPTVFISSTVDDLRHIRDAVRATVEEVGYQPVMSEYGEIGYMGGDAAEDACYRTVPECQLVVLIIGKRYGSAAKNDPDKTITELYDLWYEKKYEILGTYSSKRPPKIPLSENQEFKSIKNAIIKEAMNLNQESNQKQTAAHQKSRVSAVAVTRLFRNLCGIFQGKLDDENRQTIHQSAVDRRIRREDEAKRNAELTYD